MIQCEGSSWPAGGCHCTFLTPGAGGAQHLARLMGRGRALEVMLSANDYDADLAERYGWINRALPADEIDEFVNSLAHRIAKFPAAGHVVVKERINAIALPSEEDLRRDSDLFWRVFARLSFRSERRRRSSAAYGEMNLGDLVGSL